MDINVIVDLLGLILISVVLISFLRKKTPKDREEKLYLSLIVCVAFVLLVDIVGLLLDGQTFFGARMLLYILDTLYWFPHTVYGMLWLVFVDYKIFHRKKGMKLRIALYSLPMITEWVIIILNLNTGWLFFLNEANEYTVGSKYQLCLIPFYASIIGTICIVIYGFFKYRNVENKRNVIALFSYMFLPISAVILEIVVYGISWVWPFISLSLLMVHLNVQQRKEAEDKMKLIRLDAELTQSRISVMLSQIQPHFLFNALTAIQDLCHENPAEAEKTVIQFSRFLRGNLDSLTASKPIPFENELNHTKNYLYIELRRFKRLKVEYDIQTTEFRIPSLTLQPIVENAVRYGVTKKEDGGTVKISSRETADAYEITVSDDGVGFDLAALNDDGKNHVGIANVKSRLKAMCNGDLKIESKKEKGTIVTISVPKGEKV